METEDQYSEISTMLSEIKSQDGQTSLLEHLENMFQTKIELNDDIKYNDLFEDISIRLKAKGKYLNEEGHRQALEKYLDNFAKNIKKEKTLLEAPIREEPDSEPTPITQVNYVPDYHSLFKQLSWSGIGLSEKESYLLRNSLRNLSLFSFIFKANSDIEFFLSIQSSSVKYVSLIKPNSGHASIIKE